jgi:hypothetical protein
VGFDTDYHSIRSLIMVFYPCLVFSSQMLFVNAYLKHLRELKLTDCDGSPHSFS